MVTLLRYDVTTSLFPLQASAPTGTRTMVQLTIVASNQNPDPVMLQGLSMTMPVGDAGTDLTSDPISISPLPPDNWLLQDTQHPEGSAKYLFRPVSGQEAIGSEGLPFTFNNLLINRQPGTVAIEIMEGSKNCQPPDCPTQTLSITKFPNGWGQISFRVDPPDIATGESLILSWAGPAGATYRIEYSTAQMGTLHIPKQGQPKLANEGQYPGQSDPPLTLTETTTFTLNVEASIAGDLYSAQDQKIVSVRPSAPKIQQFIGTILWRQSMLELDVTWKIDGNADDRQISILGLQLPFALQPEGSMPIKPTADDPLKSSYTLSAQNKAGKDSSTLTIDWGKVQASIQLDRNAGPQGIAVSSDNTHVFAANYDNNTISVITMNDGQPPRLVGEPIKVGNKPIALVVTPDNTRLFVANTADNTVSVISLNDAQDLQVIATIKVGQLPSAIAVTPDNTRLFVANTADNTVSVISLNDAQDLQVIATIKVGQLPSAIAVTPDNTRLFITNTADNTVSVIDTQSLQLTGTPIKVGNAPIAVAISLDNTRLFVTNCTDNTILVIDVQRLQIIGAPIIVGNAPVTLAISPDNTHIFVTNSRDNTVSIIRMIDSQSPQLMGEPIKVGNAPIALAISPDNTRLFVANCGDNTISVIVPSSISGGTGQPFIETERQEYIMATVELPVGTIISYVGSNDSLGKLAAEGWLLCDGSRLERNRYSELFTAIGVTFGGDGIFFNSPDLRGMFQRGVNGSSGQDPDAAQRTRQGDNSVIGDVVGSRQDQQLLNHAHSWDHFFYKISWHGDDIAVSQPPDSPNLQNNTRVATNRDGGGNETRPKNVAVYYLIKAFSVFNKPGV